MSTSLIPQPLGRSGQPVQGAIALDGAVIDTSTVAGVWVEIDPQTRDLVYLSVPSGTRRVLVKNHPTDIAGTVPTDADLRASWPLAAGYWALCTDRPEGGDRFFLVLDPRDTSAAAIQADVVIFRAGGR